MNPFEMVAIIVAVVVLGSVLRTRFGGGGGRGGAGLDELRAQNQTQAQRIAQLEERVKALESVVTDGHYDLHRQFKDLGASPR